jgi:hypothetical protein
LLLEVFSFVNLTFNIYDTLDDILPSVVLPYPEVLSPPLTPPVVFNGEEYGDDKDVLA